MLEVVARSGPKFSPLVDRLTLVHQGKTRDTFAALPGTNGREQLAVAATDRLSTHNVVHESTVPLKGEVLTALTIFWAEYLYHRYGIRHHVVAFGKRIYEYLPGNRSDYPDDLHLRCIIVEKLTMIPVEFVFRAYLAGSLWNMHAAGTENPYGVALPEGARLMTKLIPPVFTPTDKSATDDPLSADMVRNQHPQATLLAERVFNATRRYLLSVGLEQVDSKYEIGTNERGEFVVADEFSTPDSSRFTLLPRIREGEEPVWYDKQLARREAQRLWNEGSKVPLAFSTGTIERITDTYLEIFERVTGLYLDTFQREFLC